MDDHRRAEPAYDHTDRLPRDRSRPLAARLAAVAAVSLFLSCGDGAAPRRVPPPAPVTEVPVVPPAPHLPPSATDPVVGALVAAGYDPDTAQKVAEYHADFLAALAADAPADRELVVKRLASLGKRRGALALVRRSPEYAGLLASVTDADALADTLGNLGGDDAVALVNALLLADDQNGRDAAVAVFARYGPLVARLQRAGLFGVETLFPESKASAADDAFDRWLTAALGDARGDDVGAVILFARDRGADIRRRLATDMAFRDRFPRELWPALARACGDGGQPLEMYLDRPKVWDVLLRPGGEKLLAKCGPLAVELLFGATYPPELRDRVAHLMLAGYAEVLIDPSDAPFRRDPQFRDLLAASLPDDLLAGAVVALRTAGAGFREPLARFWNVRNDPTAMKALVAGAPPSLLGWVPGYSALLVARKWAAGERVADDEWLEAGGDLLTVGKVVKIGREILRTGVAQTLKQSAADRAVKRVGAGLTKEAEKVLASSPGDWERARWAKSALLADARRAAAAGGATLDITAVVRLMYRGMGVGRAGFRRVSGPEARVFLRADARVVLRFDPRLIELLKKEGREKVSQYLTGLVDQALFDGPADRTAADRGMAVASLLDALLPAPR